MMEKMFKSAMTESLPAVSTTATNTGARARPRIASLQRGLSFCGDYRKLTETCEKWRMYLKQLHEKRRKIYRIMNTLHDHRLSEQKSTHCLIL